MLVLSTLVYVNLVRFSENHELEKGLKAAYCQPTKTNPPIPTNILFFRNTSPFPLNAVCEFRIYIYFGSMSIIALKISSCILSFLKMGIWTSDIRYPSGKSQDSSPNLAPIPLPPLPPCPDHFFLTFSPVFKIRDLWRSFPYLMSASFLLIRLIDGHELK